MKIGDLIGSSSVESAPAEKKKWAWGSPDPNPSGMLGILNSFFPEPKPSQAGLTHVTPQPGSITNPDLVRELTTSPFDWVGPANVTPLGQVGRMLEYPKMGDYRAFDTGQGTSKISSSEYADLGDREKLNLFWPKH